MFPLSSSMSREVARVMDALNSCENNASISIYHYDFVVEEGTIFKHSAAEAMCLSLPSLHPAPSYLHESSFPRTGICVSIRFQSALHISEKYNLFPIIRPKRRQHEIFDYWNTSRLRDDGNVDS
jgi:hypothetical protein